MDCTILKAFPFSRDGITVEDAVAGTVCDIPDLLVPGLHAARYLDAEGIAPVVLPTAPASPLTTASGPAAPPAPAGTDAGEPSEDEKRLAALAAIEIPADFETSHHMAQFNLAKKISGEQPANKAAAIEVIKAELARRAAVAI
jgi:hypothetical protein